MRTVLAAVVGVCLAGLQASPVFGADVLAGRWAEQVSAVLQPVDAASSLGVARIYEQTGNHLLWYGSQAADERRALAREVLEQAGRHGVDIADLHLEMLRADPKSAPETNRLDVLLTNAILHYAKMLRRGAVDAKYLGPDWHLRADPSDVESALAIALQTGNVAAFLNSLAPNYPQYGLLIDALAEYRRLANTARWETIAGYDELKLDDSDPRLPALRRRLAAERYLASDRADAVATRAAVQEFQRRHGLDEDGRVGKRTLRELNVPAEIRVAQIAANLERWRQFPRAIESEMVLVNAAAAFLELIEAGQTSLRMRTIVGDRKHPTPAFSAHINAVTFNPPWNVPPSIARKEMLPRLRRDPGYLAANNIVIVGRANDPFGRLVAWSSLSGRDFPYRFQQLPGPENSLGAVKFEMPNPWNVYLHDTPVKNLFARTERDRSHGCVRAQQPVELARRLLADEQHWGTDAIAGAVATGQTRTVALSRPIPVHVGYWTAFVDSDGFVNFRPDIYGRDLPLMRGLGLRDQGGAFFSEGTPLACDGASAVSGRLGLSG